MRWRLLRGLPIRDFRRPCGEREDEIRARIGHAEHVTRADSAFRVQGRVIEEHGAGAFGPDVPAIVAKADAGRAALGGNVAPGVEVDFALGYAAHAKIGGIQQDLLAAPGPGQDANGNRHGQNLGLSERGLH